MLSPASFPLFSQSTFVQNGKLPYDICKVKNVLPKNGENYNYVYVQITPDNTNILVLETRVLIFLFLIIEMTNTLLSYFYNAGNSPFSAHFIKIYE